MGKSLQEALASYDRDKLPPGPMMSAAPVDAPPPDVDPMAAQRRAEVLAAAEANPNGQIAPVSLQQQLAQGAPAAINGGPLAPIAPREVSTKEIPVFNSMGQQIGTRIEGQHAVEAGRIRQPEEIHRDTPEEQAKIAADNAPVGYPMKTDVQPAQLPPPAAKPSLQQQVAGGGGPSPFEKLYEQQKGEDLASYRRQHELSLQQQQLAHEHAAGETIYRDQAVDRADKQAGELKGGEAEYRAAVDDFKNDKIDEDHFWKNRSAGQKAAGFLAAAFGGFLQGFNHLASNPALDQMNHAIDRDIMVQRANHEDKRAAADAQKGMYGMMLDRFHNANVAADMAHAGYLEVIRAKGDEMAAKQNDEGARDAWMTQRQRIDREILSMQQRAAASGQMTPERALKLAQDAANIDKTRAETTKLGSESAAGPKLTDEQKAQREVTADVGGIESFKPKAAELTRGTGIGQMFAEHAPGWVPGVQDARAALNERGDYNNRVKTTIAAAYKLSTDANEPKNLALIESLAGPYELNSGDRADSAVGKMSHLQQLIIDSGRAKGATDNPLQKAVASGGAPKTPKTFAGTQ